jgi:hypothetical protein
MSVHVGFSQKKSRSVSARFHLPRQHVFFPVKEHVFVVQSGGKHLFDIRQQQSAGYGARIHAGFPAVIFFRIVKNPRKEPAAYRTGFQKIVKPRTDGPGGSTIQDIFPGARDADGFSPLSGVVLTGARMTRVPDAVP